VTLLRWVQRFTPLLVEVARPCRHAAGGHWFVDETYVKVSGTWRYVCRAVDQDGQVIDVFLSKRRNLKAETTFFARAIASHRELAEITTDRAHALIRVVTEPLPAALHDTTQYAHNRVEADHGRLKARLRPMRGLKRDRTATVVIRAMPSSRTSGGVTASSGLTPFPGSPWARPSTSSHWQSEWQTSAAFEGPCPPISQRNRAGISNPVMKESHDERPWLWKAWAPFPHPRQSPNALSQSPIGIAGTRAELAQGWSGRLQGSDRPGIPTPVDPGCPLPPV
jgi:transposase-like protein